MIHSVNNIIIALDKAAGRAILVAITFFGVIDLALAETGKDLATVSSEEIAAEENETKTWVESLISEIRLNKNSRLEKLAVTEKVIFFSVEREGTFEYSKLQLSNLEKAPDSLTKNSWSKGMLEAKSAISVSIRRKSENKISYIVGTEEYEFDERLRKFSYKGEILTHE